MFGSVFFYQIWATIENGVGCIVTEKQKKGFVAMLCYKINCFDVQSVSEVFLLTKSIIGNVNPADGLVAKT